MDKNECSATRGIEMGFHPQDKFHDEFPSKENLKQEYKAMVEALEEFMNLPDTYHFLNFIDGNAGPVTTPAARNYRRLRYALLRAKAVL